MKTRKNHFRKLGAALCASILISSCKVTQSPELIGQWSTNENIKITVCAETENNWQFTTGQGKVELNIKADFTVDGIIGQTGFENKKIHKNPDAPSAYIIKCGKIWRTFDNDPLDSKEVHIWLNSVEREKIAAEMKYNNGGEEAFMASMILIRDKPLASSNR